jgi:hypothetical protein
LTHAQVISSFCSGHRGSQIRIAAISPHPPAQTAEMFICTGVVHKLLTCQSIQSSSSAHLLVLTRKGRNASRSKGWAQGCVAFFWGPKVSAADSSGLIQKRAASASNPGRPCYLGTDQVPAGLFFPPQLSTSPNLSKPPPPFYTTISRSRSPSGRHGAWSSRARYAGISNLGSNKDAVTRYSLMINTDTREGETSRA